jgi:DNA-binding transcriptional MerR regulator
MFKIGDFSRLSQISVKTLRYYDEIGLLKPSKVDQFTGYRLYSADQLPRLNYILP